MQRRSFRLANSVGILATDIWSYYVDNFQCSHFVGTGTEDNYYLFLPSHFILEAANSLIPGEGFGNFILSI